MKKPLSFLRLLTLLLAVIWVTPSLAQISAGGTPPSFKYEEGQMTLKSAKKLPIDFDVKAMRIADVEREAAGMPPHVGKIIPVDNLTTENSGEWTTLPDGQRIWRLTIEAKDAIAIMLTYDKFEIPAGGKLFIYNADRSRVLGAYTEVNNPKRVEYATEFVSGDQLTLEYVAPKGSRSDSPIVLTGVVYGYNHLYFESPEGGPSRISFGASGACMVNVNCPEGDNWKDEKQGVTRIVTATGGGYYALCSGTVLNNTARNLDPLFLSAFHCYEDLTAAQINQSIYYFKYEHPTCTGRSDPTVPTVTGATMLVNIPMNGGSDGSLLRLNESIPLSYGVYFNGWDRRNTPATSGVGIHHPNADVKKISTYTQAAQSTGNVSFQGGAVTAPNSEWLIYFAQTTSGWGVTEGGSSGSPMFDQNHRVVGTLSGGNSSCDNTSGRNIYGKLWYHWDQSSNNSQWMKPYLDPVGTNEEFIDGTYEAGSDPIAGFRANQTDIYAAQSVTFTDASNGANTWEWSFTGGTPSSYSGKTPPAITYNTVGSFPVSLTINKGTDTENTKTEANYIKVTQKQNECKDSEIIGTGTTGQSYPLGTVERQEMSSALYTAAELNMPTGGAITSLSWYAGSNATTRTRQIFVYLKEVDATTQTPATWANEISGATLAFQSQSSWVSEAGWVELTLIQPFQYSGTKNLKVMVRSLAASSGTYQSSDCYYTATPNTHMVWKATTTTIPTTPGTVNDNRPNIKLNVTKPCAATAAKADFYNNKGEILLAEGFDGTIFPPTGWTLETKGAATNTWSRSTAISFASIDPTSTASAYINYNNANIVNSWLKTPSIAVPNSRTVAEFYLSYQGIYISGGYVNFYVSTDGTTWEKLWTTGNSESTGVPSGWKQMTIDLSAYKGQSIQLAWQYYGRDGWNIALDGVNVYSATDKIEIFEGETVSFTDVSTGPPVLWEWTLPGSDVETSTDQNVPNAYYRNHGSYTASLKAVNNLGSDTKTVTNSVVVKARTPNVGFVSYSNNGFNMKANYGQFLTKDGGPVLFENRTEYFPDYLKWTLTGADPATSTEESFVAEYPAGTGTYAVSLEAGNSAGAATVNIPDYIKLGGTADIWNIPYGDEGLALMTFGYTSFIFTYTACITGSNPYWNMVAEKFIGTAPGEITKVDLMARVASGNPAAFTVAIYSDNNGVPGTQISPAISVPRTSINASGYTTVTFSEPVGVDKVFHVVVGGLLVGSGSTNLVAILTSDDRQTTDGFNTVYAFYQNSWVAATDLFTNEPSISMNIVTDLTYTEAELTSDDMFKRKDVDPTVGTVAFTTTGHTWRVAADNWITLSASTGTVDASGQGSFTFTCDDNTSPAVRYGKMTVYAGGVPLTVNVTQGGSYPANFAVTYDDEEENVLLTWGSATPPQPGQGFFEDVESHTDFAINSPGSIGWSYIDGDGKPTYGYSNVSFPGMGSAMAFVVLNPAATTPSVEDTQGAHSGTRFFASFNPDDASQANDWIISPELTFGSEFKISFWARSLTTQYGAERFKVGYSTSGKAQGNFTFVSPGSYVEAPADWAFFEYTIPAGAKYVAINCISTDAFAFFVDDIYVGTGSAPTPTPVSPAKTKMIEDMAKLAVKKTPAAAITPIGVAGLNIAGVIVNSEDPKAMPVNENVIIKNSQEQKTPKKQRLSPLYSLEAAKVNPNRAQANNASAPDKAAQEVLMRWDNGENYSSIGIAAGSEKIQVAIRFEKTDLMRYKNATIKAVDIYTNAAATNMELRIWEDGAIVYTQAITGLTPGQFSRVTLNTPRALNTEKELMVSYRFDQAAGQENYVPGSDAGPAVAGKGDLIALGDDNLESLVSLNPQLNYNWNMAVVLEADVEPTTYKVFRLDTPEKLLASGITEEQYRDMTGVINETYCYQINATYLGDPFFESVRSPQECVFVKSPLRVTADNKQMRENDTPPALTATFSGKLLDGDQYADVISYSLACAVDQSTVAGTYPIEVTVECLDSAKYVVKGVEGIMTVNVYETVIGTQPVGGTVCTGSNFTFTVVMADGLEVTYQWQKETNGAWHNISGANQPSYTINNVTPDDAGLYRVLLSGRTSVVVSEPALLKVALSPASIVVYEWNNVPTINCNSATNGGYTFVAFQWYKGTTPIGNKPYITKDAGATDCEITCSDGRIFRLCNFTNPVSDAVLTAYPNPVTEGQNITVSLTNAPQGSIINIYNLNGGLVKGNIPMTGSESSVNINGFMPGMYVIQVSSPDGIKHTTKIVVK